MSDLNYYIKKFQKLRSDRNANWPVVSLNRSPYKPLLLLSVMDLFGYGSISSNLVELSSDLSELFDLYCQLIMPPDRRCNIAMPFFHLSREGFWQLIPIQGKEDVIASGRRLQSVGLLTDNVRGARLDKDLYAFLCAEKSRNILRATLIETYFAPALHPKLIEQGIINNEAFEYSQLLLANARQQTKEEQITQKQYQQPARDQGFRHAVVQAYNHRCALCGIRVLTPAGHTAMTAAHIIPWSISYNDDPRNGIALCPLCHWTFDEGLLGISAEYVVLTSPQLATHQNVPGHLATLKGRGMIGPNEQPLWPDPNALIWHLREVFLKY